MIIELLPVALLLAGIDQYGLAKYVGIDEEDLNNEI